MSELIWREPIQIPDGTHKAVITKIKERSEPFEYTDIFCKIEGTDFEIKYGCPSVLSENSKLGRLLNVMGAKYEKGGKVDPAVVLKGRKVELMTITRPSKKDPSKSFSEIVVDSIKPLPEPQTGQVDAPVEKV